MTPIRSALKTGPTRSKGYCLQTGIVFVGRLRDRRLERAGFRESVSVQEIGVRARRSHALAWPEPVSSGRSAGHLRVPNGTSDGPTSTRNRFLSGTGTSVTCIVESHMNEAHGTAECPFERSNESAPDRRYPAGPTAARRAGTCADTCIPFFRPHTP
jgi:hypothetical protein